MRRIISEICFFLADLSFGLAELFLLIARKVRKRVVGILMFTALSACTPPAQQLPKGFFCWPDKGYIVCQFVGTEQEKSGEAPRG